MTKRATILCVAATFFAGVTGYLVWVACNGGNASHAIGATLAAAPAFFLAIAAAVEAGG